MSEVRLERIENQLERVIQGVETVEHNVSVMQHNMTTIQQNMTTMQQDMISMQQDMISMQRRVDSMEGTLLTAMTDGFSSLQRYLTDLDIDLAQNERKTEDVARRSRRLNQRLIRLEQSYDNF
jgi:chromosome segregation ATPase